MKQVLLMVAGKSEVLCKVLRLMSLDDSPAPPMTIYRRNKLSCIAMLLRGLTSPSNAKYRLHFEQTSIGISTRSKQAIHEQAMAMGLDDPLAADYSRFMEKAKKKYRATIAPLDHGHLHYKGFINDRVRNEAATKIQSIVEPALPTRPRWLPSERHLTMRRRWLSRSSRRRLWRI